MGFEIFINTSMGLIHGMAFSPLYKSIPKPAFGVASAGGISYKREKGLPVSYRGKLLKTFYKAD